MLYFYFVQMRQLLHMKFCKSLFNGNQLAKKIINQTKEIITRERMSNLAFYQSYQEWASPQLHIINVGFDDASLSYIKKKIDLASSIGIKFQLHQFLQNRISEERYHQTLKKMMRSTPSQNFKIRELSVFQPNYCFNEISKLIDHLNSRREVSGILLQLPLQPILKQYTKELINQIDPLKDVDCLTIGNRTKIIQHVKPQLMPCTPSAVLKILDQYNIDVTGKKIVIAGRSSLVGLPLFHLLLNRNATITLCHGKTTNLNELTKTADIVISAVGKSNLITQLKFGGIAIDIGISRDSHHKLCGDISQKAKENCTLATPVPGGVGPLTVAMLMENTVTLWKAQMRLQQNLLNV